MTTVEIVAIASAVLLAASRLLTVSEPLWSFIPTKARWLPPVLLVAIPQIVAALGGVKTSLDLTVTLVMAVTLIVPGARSATHAALADGPKTPQPPPLAMLALAVLMLLGASGCSGWKPAARTANDIAGELCGTFFADKMKVSFEDAVKAACNTRADLEPWLDQVLAAKRTAGPLALARHSAPSTPPDAGAP